MNAIEHNLDGFDGVTWVKFGVQTGDEVESAVEASTGNMTIHLCVVVVVAVGHPSSLNQALTLDVGCVLWLVGSLSQADEPDVTAWQAALPAADRTRRRVVSVLGGRGLAVHDAAVG